MSNNLKNLYRLGIFLVFVSIFAAIEFQLSREYASPSHPVLRRHQIIPGLALENKLFREYEGNTLTQIPLDLGPLDVSVVRGVRFKTGAYGKVLDSALVSITDDSGAMICASQEPVTIAENDWTSARLVCSLHEGKVPQGFIVNVQLKTANRWALYRAAGEKPAIQIWLDDPAFKGAFGEARNYGALWSEPALFMLRAITRVLIAAGLAFMLVPTKYQPRQKLLWAVLVWLGVFWGQFFETVTFHNPDETMHVIGAFRDVTDPSMWPGKLEEMKRLGGAVQLHETYAQNTKAIVATRPGESWFSDDGWIVSPKVRSGIYDFMVRPMAQGSLLLSDKFAVFCKDPVVYLRAQLSALVAIILALGFWFHLRHERWISCWILIGLSMIPATLTSLLTVWNYGMLTAIGGVFAVCVLPEQKGKSSEKSLFLASLLIPVLGEMARSQVLWFVVGPLAVVSSWVYLYLGDKTRARCLKGILKSAGMSIAAYFILLMILQDRYLPERTMVHQMIGLISDHLGISRGILGQAPMLTLAGLQLGAWAGTTMFMISLDSILKYVAQQLPRGVLNGVKVSWVAVLSVSVVMIIFKCWSIHEEHYLSSLASTPYLPFAAHFKEGYRALMSQMFTRYQDYFLVQTFFMAYGWLEVTGSWLVYVLYRHLMELGIVMVIVASVINFRAFVLCYAPLMAAFFIYFLGIWYAAWAGHFTVVGRFVFPAIGLLYIPLIVATICVVSGEARPTLNSVATRTLLTGLFLFLLISACYGAFYVLPLRFIIGL